MFPIHQAPSAVAQRDAAPANGCGSCGTAEPLGFQFDYAYQPIVDVVARSSYAHEALVRGPAGEGALSVLSQVTVQNRYRFDQAVPLGVRHGLGHRIIPRCHHS